MPVKSNQVALKNVRISFAKVYHPAFKYQSDTDKEWSAEFWLTPEQLAQVKDVAMRVAKDAWADKAQAFWKDIERNSPKNFCFRTKYDKNSDTDILTIRAKRAVNRADGAPNNPPQIYMSGKSGELWQQGMEEEIYSGCYVNCVLSLYAYNNKAKGISADLAAVQFYKDGDRLDRNGTVDADVFADMADTGEDEETPW